MISWRERLGGVLCGGFLALIILTFLLSLIGCASTKGLCKPKKPNTADDDDRDGVVVAILPLVEYRGVFYGYMIHICCGDALTHIVEFRVYRTPLFHLPVIWMRWTVDEQRTHEERVKRFGAGYWQPFDNSSEYRLPREQ